MNSPNDFRPSKYAFPSLQSIIEVEQALPEALGRHIYVGGACVGFYVDDLGAAEIRPTDDVDIAIEIASEVERVRIDDMLRKSGFLHDMLGPICRWRLNNLIVDIMPVSTGILGFSNRWYKDAIQTSIAISFPDVTVAIPDVCSFLATKIEAFNDRGRDDFIGSTDFEDIMRVLDGCSFLEIEGRQSSIGVREFVANTFRKWLDRSDFGDAIAAHLLEEDGLERRSLVMRRIDVLVQLAN